MFSMYWDKIEFQDMTDIFRIKKKTYIFIFNDLEPGNYDH